MTQFVVVYARIKTNNKKNQISTFNVHINFGNNRFWCIRLEESVWLHLECLLNDRADTKPTDSVHKFMFKIQHIDAFYCMHMCAQHICVVIYPPPRILTWNTLCTVTVTHGCESMSFQKKNLKKKQFQNL